MVVGCSVSSCSIAKRHFEIAELQWDLSGYDKTTKCMYTY